MQDGMTKKQQYLSVRGGTKPQLLSSPTKKF